MAIPHIVVALSGKECSCCVSQKLRMASLVISLNLHADVALAIKGQEHGNTGTETGTRMETGTEDA